MKKQFGLIIISFLLSVFTVAQQKVIQLYDGPAPGSETWNWNEGVNDNNMFGTKVVYNVTSPTLTVFLPDSAAATGTAVIICPGGGFHTLSINSEGNDVAHWLVEKGVAAFVLKYRLAHSLTDDPVKELMSKMGKPEFDEENNKVIPLAVADGRKAISYVREHADEFGISPDKVGIIGFSAGGTVAAAAALGYDKINRPDFAAPIYPYFPDSMISKIPDDSPPMFILAATNDQLGLAPHSVNLYNRWVAAKHPAELHLYEKGGHGFGMRTQHLPTDKWIERFGDWLKLNGYLKLLHPPAWAKQYTEEQLEEMRKKNEERFHNDWANLKKYEEQNKQLASGKNNGKRVVFMGNSITEGWKNLDSAFFAPSTNNIDRGISGQTTPQMLVRFREDVIDLKPAVVVILAGINDIAENTGPTTLEAIYGNIVSMAELAKAYNIRVVLSSVLPAYDFPWHKGLQPAEKVVALNKMIKAYALKKNIDYLDYFSVMADEKNALKKDLTFDGVHPNLAGYKVMEPLAEKAISEALKR